MDVTFRTVFNVGLRY